MNEKEQRQDIFGYNPTGKLTELQEINSEAWPLISAPPKNANPKPSSPPRDRRSTNNRDRGQTVQKRQPETLKKSPKPQEKKKSGYVSSSMGMGKKKSSASPKGRISEASKGTKRPESTSERKTNKRPESANNMKRPPERTPKGERVQERRQQSQAQRQAANRNNGKTPLTKQQQNQIRKQNEIYERGRRQGKSKDEIRREQQLRQIKQRKRKTVLAFISFILIVVFALGFYIHNNVAIIENIKVEGGSTYSMKKVIKSSGVIKGDKLFSVSEKRVRELLTNELPYIKDVDLSYGFPDTLTITVTPTRDKLLLAHKNKYLRLDVDGKVLAASKTKMKEGLYKVEGLTYKKHSVGSVYSPVIGEESKYETARSIALEAEKVGLLIGTVNVKDMEKITFTYDGRVRIYLGDASELRTKMEFAAKTIAVAATDKQTGYIDMRFSERGYFSEGSMDNT